MQVAAAGDLPAADRAVLVILADGAEAPLTVQVGIGDWRSRWGVRSGLIRLRRHEQLSFESRMQLLCRQAGAKDNRPEILTVCGELNSIE